MRFLRPSAALLVAAALFVFAFWTGPARAYDGDGGTPAAADASTDARGTTPDAGAGGDGDIEAGAVPMATSPVAAPSTPPPAPAPSDDAGAPAPFQPAIVATPVVATPVTNGATPGGPSAPPSGHGFAFGLHVAWGFPFGTSKDTALSDSIPSAFHFGGDVGYYFSPHFYVGVYTTYGVSVGNINLCTDPDLSCNAEVIRFGAVADYHFLVNPTFDPWVGGGIGYEILNFIGSDTTGQGNDISASSSGLKILPRAGLDWKPAPRYGLGPYVEVPLGHYWGATSAVHGWAITGIRIYSLL